MKKIIIALFISSIYLTSCSSGRMAARNTDDVYYSDRDVIANRYEKEDASQQTTSAQPKDYSSPGSSTENNQQPNQNDAVNNNATDGQSNSGNERFDYNADQRNSNTTQSTDQDGNTYITNNYYTDDDYYDYAYTSRVRRFYHPCGWSFYDPYYTNLYWYDYDPFSYGVSVYLTYNWWRPQYMWTPGWGVSIGYGSPYYSSWYGGGYGGGYGYNHGYQNGYMNGYANGYYNGLYNGTFNPYYYNSNDSYSYYYGPRGGKSNAVANNTPRAGRNISELYGRKMAVENPRTPKLTPAYDGINAIGRDKRDIGYVKGKSELPDTKIKTNTGRNLEPSNPASVPGKNSIPVRPNKIQENQSDGNSGTINKNEKVPVKQGVNEGNEISPSNGIIKDRGGKNTIPEKQYTNPKEYTSPSTSPEVKPHDNNNENQPGNNNPPRQNTTPRTIQPRNEQPEYQQPQQNVKPRNIQPKQQDQQQYEQPKQKVEPRKQQNQQIDRKPRSEAPQQFQQPNFEQSKNSQPRNENSSRSYSTPSGSNPRSSSNESRGNGRHR